jgi:hypothetical protein
MISFNFKAQCTVETLELHDHKLLINGTQPNYIALTGKLKQILWQNKAAKFKVTMDKVNVYNK